MNKNKSFLTVSAIALCGVAMFSSCSDDDNSVDPIGISIPDAQSLTVDKSKVLQIVPKITNAPDATYSWAIGDSIISTNDTLDFIELTPGVYDLTFTAKTADQTQTQACKITVNDAEYSALQTKLVEYKPALFNSENVITTPYNEFMNEANADIKAGKSVNLDLGCWGGYVVYAFDHTVKNISGAADILVNHNGSAGSYSYGIFYVAYDKNKNGKPDDDEWYEIKGSYYGTDKETTDYEITYQLPTTDVEKYVQESIWSDNKGNTGKVSFFWYENPDWAWPGYRSTGMLAGWTAPLKFKGSLLEWMGDVDDTYKGYLNHETDINVNIDDAVDSKGQPANLIGVDFIKVQTATSKEINEVAGYYTCDMTSVKDIHIAK